MLEKRRFVRVPEEAEISYRILPNSETETFVSKDISQGGIRFFVGEYVSQNRLIEIRFTIKEIHFSFKALAKTKWVRKETHGDRFEVGAEFVNLPQETTDHLIQYIKKVLHKPPNH